MKRRKRMRKLALLAMACLAALAMMRCDGDGGEGDADEDPAPDSVEAPDEESDPEGEDDADGPDADAPEDIPREEVPAVDFDSQIQPLFSANCIFCHGGSTPPGGLDLTSGRSYDNLVGVESQGYAPALRVAPGDTAASVLYNKLNDTGVHGDVMPPSGVLPQEQRDTFEWWILGL